MKVLQINAVYEILSTGRNMKETHEFLLNQGVDSYIACADIVANGKNFYQIGTKLDHKIHALMSRLFGLQGYYSKRQTRGLIGYIENIEPDVIILHNLHSNYIHFGFLLEEISKRKIPVVFVLHDCWFFTGKCVYYTEDECFKWKEKCGDCPALKKGNISWFFDRSARMLNDKRRFYQYLYKYAVIGVSEWVTNDAKRSILKDADIFKTVYNWVDLEKFCPISDSGEFKRERDLAHKFVILGVAASWNKKKGIHIFFELSSMIDDNATIVLIGDLDEKYKNDKIVALGRIDSIKDLALWYAAADVFLNPSLQETFGKTTAEALACGTPVVGYRKTATTELVGDDGHCGILMRSQKASDYYDAISHIRDKGKKYYQAACRGRAERLFDKNKNLKEYLNLLVQLIENKNEGD